MRKVYFPKVDVVMPMRNSSTTILLALKSLEKQKYPISKIIIVDNASTDDSIQKVKIFKKSSKIHIDIIRRSFNKGVASSYNIGVLRAKSSLVVFMHSDSSLTTENEIMKLTKPLRLDPKVVASYSTNILPERIWKSYSFWQKCHQSREVGKNNPGMNGKLDCIRRNIFLKIKGFDEKTYSDKYGVGGEDASLYLSLQKEGKVVLSTSKVIHLHQLSGDYSLADWINNRKLLARTYGTLIRLKGKSLPIDTTGRGKPFGVLLFMIKPLLAILPFIPVTQLLGFFMLFFYSLINSKKMYTTILTIKNPRIILLPIIDIFLIYYETFWMFEALIFLKRRR